MPKDTPAVVVCHGLTGGSHESYVRNVLAWVVKPKSEGGLGGRAVVINVSSVTRTLEIADNSSVVVSPPLS